MKRIVLGENSRVLPTLPAQSVDAIITDQAANRWARVAHTLETGLAPLLSDWSEILTMLGGHGGEEEATSCVSEVA